jgi:heat shock protein HtpX
MFGNWLKTSILMAAIVALFGAVGAVLGGKGGMLIALLIGATTNLFAYWNSDKMVLRLYNAREVDATTGGRYYAIVEELAHRAALPMPRVYVIDEAQPNAFATGRNPDHAAVAATTGVIQLLSENELRGVIAHELTHVRNRDTLISTMSATVAGAISMVANFGFFFGGGNDRERQSPAIAIIVMILAPVAAMLIQMAISRSREFGADAGGAAISGDPESLASALRKIEAYAQGRPLSAAELHPETAQMMIINPLSPEGIKGLFSTHPPTEARIARLMQIARGG